MMIALSGDALGGPEGYALRKIAVPEPGAGQVRVRIEATGLGYVDHLIAAGFYQYKPTPPYVPGAEIVGIVDRLGSGVTGVKIGDRVASWQLLVGGGVAQYALSPAEPLVAVPDRLASAAAASMILDYLTAYHGLIDRGGLRAGETVLVLAAAGGVGAAAVQIATAHGARVVAAASTPEKRARARRLGADAVVDYTTLDWRDDIKRLAPAGVDIVFDPVGGASFELAFRSIGKGGRHLILGFLGGDIPRLPINLPLLKSGALIGVDARHLFESDCARAREIWAKVFAWAEAETLRAPDMDLHRLSTAEVAFAALPRRDRIGKIVIVP